MVAGAWVVDAIAGARLKPGAEEVAAAAEVVGAVELDDGAAEEVGAPKRGLLGAADAAAPPNAPNKGLLASELVAGVEDD